MPSTPSPWVRTGDALDTVNEVFHESYSDTKAGLAQEVPVIVMMGDLLVLQRRGERIERTVTPVAHHALRSVAHAPIALFTLLRRDSPGELSEPILAQLRLLDERLRSSLKELNARLVDTAARADAETILKETLGQLDRCVSRASVGADELAGFARLCGPMLLRLADHATRLQLEVLHPAAESLLAELSPEELARLQVVVAGAHQARERSLGMQYFCSRLGEPSGKERRVAYAENVADEAGALALVGTRQFDAALALAFFGDSQRLQRDVLGDAVHERLRGLNFEKVFERI